MKHTKPFRCHIPGCKRQTQGFTSANDRDRHMNSVHKRNSGRGAVGYDCVYDHCRGNGKIFWRLDNFRNHLKKKHGTRGAELDEFLKRYVHVQVLHVISPLGMNSDVQYRRGTLTNWNQHPFFFELATGAGLEQVCAVSLQKKEIVLIPVCGANLVLYTSDFPQASLFSLSYPCKGWVFVPEGLSFSHFPILRAETDCRRVYSHQQIETESPMDTQSEPGCPMPLTPMESPDPAMSEDSRQAKRTRFLPPVPPFGSSWSDSEGRGTLPISPVSRGPHQDLASDPGDQMDLDDPPAQPGVAASRPRIEEPSTTERKNSSPISRNLSRTNSKALSERQEQMKARAEERLRRLGELHEKIKKYPKILDEYRDLCREEWKERGEAGQNWPQYDYLYPIGGSEISARTMSVSKGRNNSGFQRGHSKDRSIEPELDRIEENDQDRMEHESSRMLRNNSHALQTYVGQSPTDESPISRIMSSGGTVSTAAGLSASSAMSTIQAENQGALISPPVSVASPQVASKEISQTHQQQQRPSVVIPDDETPKSARVQHRNSSAISTSSRPTHTLLPHEKSTICPECDKLFTMPSKLK